MNGVNVNKWMYLREWLIALAPYIVGIGSAVFLWFKVETVHLALNSRLDEFIATTKKSSFAEGVEHQKNIQQEKKQ